MDKRCGTCVYWEFKDDIWGDCKYPVPNWVCGKNETGEHYGTSCPCWRKKEEE